MLSIVRFHQEQGVETAVGITIHSSEDLKINKFFLDSGVKTIIRTLSRLGRGRKLRLNDQFLADNIHGEKCPSFAERGGIVERLHFNSQIGFTNCCANLNLKSKLEKKFKYIYSNSIISRKDSLTRYLLKNYSVDEISKTVIEFDPYKFHSVCDLCEKIFGSIGRDICFLQDVLHNGYSPFNDGRSHLNVGLLKLLKPTYQFSYILKGELQPIREKSVLSDSFKMESQKTQNSEDIEHFYKRTFLNYFSEHFSSEQKRQNLAILSSATMMNAELNLVIKKDERIVSFIVGFVHRYDFFDSDTFHIGFIGIDKKHLSKHEIEEIKAVICEKISQINTKKLPLSARIDPFNLRSLYFMRKIGLRCGMIVKS